MNFSPPANEVCEGYVFTGVCLSTGGGDVCGRAGACTAGGGCAWQGGVHGGGACMTGGMHGKGACMVGDMRGRGGVRATADTTGYGQ